MTVNINTIDDYIWKVQKSIMKNHGCTIAENDICPLVWYIDTGRASTLFLKKLMAAKPFIIARKLHKGGSYDEIIDRIKEYIEFTE